MALQDLTPQLRTRLGRLERLVGLFVAVAVVLLVVGLAYYVWRTAERKGWFVRKLPYFTFVNNASGLRVGDPVKLMGFDIGEITEITAQPPFDYYDVYVAFVVKEEFVGYLWDDSRALVASGDFLGKRVIELTKGTSGPPTYVFHGIQTLSLEAVRGLIGAPDRVLAQSVYDRSGTNLLARPFEPVTKERCDQFEAGGVGTVRVLDKATRTKWPTGLWDYQAGQYVAFDRRGSKGFFLPPREAPALAARLEQLATVVETALPNVLGLTNRIQRVMDEAIETTLSADRVLDQVRPLVANLTVISGHLTNAQGSLGEWLIAPELRRELERTLAGAQLLLTNSSQRVDAVSDQVTIVLVQLAAVTSNLNAQVVANSNILSEISAAVTNADHLMQGLKRHWLLRSAFRDEGAVGGTPRTVRPAPGRAVAPKYEEPRRTGTKRPGD